MAESTPEALERQIADLQHQLEVSRQERGADTSAPYERSEVHAAIGEQVPVQTPTQSPSTSSGDVPSYQDPALAPQVQQLVNIAFTQGITQAIQEAMKSGNPALVDALHDVLADEFHQELLKRQKVQPAA